MRVPIFAKIVAISMFISLLSLVLFLASFQAPSGAIIVYVIYTFIIIAGISFFVAGTITRPVKELMSGFEKLMEGEMTTVTVATGDELEELANSFNYMVRVLFRQKEEIKKSEERYRNLVEDINDWVFELDEELNFTYSSGKVKDLLGYEVEEVVGRNINEFLSQKLGGIPESRVELVFLAKDGRSVVAEVSFRQFRKGSVSGYRAVCRDVTHRKRVEERMSFLASIVENVVDAVVSFDLSGKITNWNKGAEITFGFKSKDVLGKHYTTIIPKSQWKLWEEKLKLVRDGGSARFESYGIRANGDKVRVEVTLTRVGNSFAAIARDVTLRKEAEEKLRKAYEQLEERTAELLKSRKELEYLANIVENSSDAIYSVDLSGKITSWNRTAEKLFGWRKEEAIGMHADELLPEELKGETELILRKLFDGITSMTYETRRLNRNGDLFSVEVTISPLYNGDSIGGFSVIARDITAKVEAESRMLRRVLKYDLEKGKLYLVTDRSLAVDIVEDFVKCGCNALVISRYVEVRGARNLRLSDRKGKMFVLDFRDIERAIISTPGWNNVVLLELDYLISKKGFDATLRFVQQLRDSLYVLGKGVVVLCLDPEVVGDKELKALSKECDLVKAKPTQHTMPAKCYEILRHVYMQNRVGESVSFAELMDVFKISRNTVKKYVRQLESMGLVKVVKDGRYKVVTLTQKGRELFSENYELEFV